VGVWEPVMIFIFHRISQICVNGIKNTYFCTQCPLILDILCAIMTAIEQIRVQIDKEVFDYSQLMHALSGYKKPRDVVTNLIGQGKIIRIKKGLYIFGELWRRASVEPASLAGLIFGPSAISLEYALAWHGLIPERVAVVTSVTTGRSREFNTPLKRFTYTHLGSEKFAVSIVRHVCNSGGFMMAEPVKALADKIWTDKRCKPNSAGYFNEYLFDDMRINEDILKDALICDEMDIVESAYHSRKINLLFLFLKKRFGFN